LFKLRIIANHSATNSLRHLKITAYNKNAFSLPYRRGLDIHGGRSNIGAGFSAISFGFCTAIFTVYPYLSGARGSAVG
jgi:hypothetical protein